MGSHMNTQNEQSQVTLGIAQTLKDSSTSVSSPLHQQIVAKVSKGAALALCLSVLILGWFFHHQLHHQTDAILLLLSATEANNFSQYYPQLKSDQTQSTQLKTTVVPFPWGGGTVISVHSAIYDKSCKLLAHTHQFGPKFASSSACLKLNETSFMSTDNGVELRVARYHSKNGFLSLVGIEHARLDVSLWRAVLLSILVSFLVWISIWAITNKVVKALTRDLVLLDQLCQKLDLNTEQGLEGSSFKAMVFSSLTSSEILNLSATLNTLLFRLQNKVKSQRRFIAEAAHELRTPLTGLRGEIEVTLRRPRSTEGYQETLIYLANDVERLISLSNRLLSSIVDQERAFELESLSLEELLMDAIDSLILTEQDQERINIEDKRIRSFFESVNIQQNSMIYADRDASLRAIINILQNSLIHSQASMIALSIRHYSKGNTEYISLQITDNGIGFPEHLASYLFTPFIRGEPQGLPIQLSKKQEMSEFNSTDMIGTSTYSSHGLGLSITKDLMAKQNGSITILPESYQHNGVKIDLTWISANQLEIL